MLKKIFSHKPTRNACHIYGMLSKHAKRKHISFHTPGHKMGKWDITELCFSDNLSCPRGCIAEAEKDIAQILGANAAFILTDGSTSGVFSMLHAAKAYGVKTVAVEDNAHKSVFNGCALLGLTPLIFQEYFSAAWQAADAVFLTSPNYYGEIPDLAKVRDFCSERNKLLLIDGAHGGHLHYHTSLYAGAYADLWVDGVHKNLPAFTQGAVVLAKTQPLSLLLREAVDIFRTTSPSYPIMASVEYAVKYPENKCLPALVFDYAKNNPRIDVKQDWTKFGARFGKNAFSAMRDLEKEGVYAEFCDGNVILFYLSPATSKKQFQTLCSSLEKLFTKYPLDEVKGSERIPAPAVFEQNGETEWVLLSRSAGKICAQNCGLFPPCTPLIKRGERIQEDKIVLLKKADNVYGLWENKICVFKSDTSE